MAETSFMYYTGYQSMHFPLIVPFLAEDTPTQQNYDELKADVTHIKQKAEEKLAWYGPSPGLGILSTEQIRSLTRAISGLQADLVDLAAFAVTKSLTP